MEKLDRAPVAKIEKPYGDVPEGFVRVAPLANLAQSIRRFGVDPEALFASIGLSGELFANPANTISLQTVGELLDRCVAATGCRHFGLTLGRTVTARSLGMIGELLPHCADVGTALVHLQNFFHLNDRGAIPTRTVDGDTATLGYTLFAGPVAGVDQILDGTMVVALNLMRLLCGPQWKPRAVLLSRCRPENQRPYQQIFQCPIEFDAENSSLVFPAGDLKLPIAGADPNQFKLLKEQLDNISSQHGLDTLAQVRRLVLAMAVLRRCSLAAVAGAMSINPRRLNRMLEREGTSYRELFDDVRCGLALRLIRHTDLSLAQIATVLDYSGASAFAHAFKRWQNVSPLAWRRMHGRPVAATAVTPPSPADAEHP
ncbi:MAG TPA: AraC family transcriptional regulator [Accumulibacter sp.]|uniref:AraC family transcriptional regulator n=1 Tax=Accumulibacter sp. TaxID=2053492 RepID=UPI002C25BE90|nr:AraC family transcriptional regulator [Accumulibacter sp.]HRF72880.1 AraC family transcriptional regulator [Accumulibacter sp.]